MGATLNLPIDYIGLMLYNLLNMYQFTIDSGQKGVLGELVDSRTPEVMNLTYNTHGLYDPEVEVQTLHLNTYGGPKRKEDVVATVSHVPGEILTARFALSVPARRLRIADCFKLFEVRGEAVAVEIFGTDSQTGISFLGEDGNFVHVPKLDEYNARIAASGLAVAVVGKLPLKVAVAMAKQAASQDS